MNVQNVSSPSDDHTRQPPWLCLPCRLSFDDKTSPEMHRTTDSHHHRSAGWSHYCMSCQPRKHCSSRTEWRHHRHMVHSITGDAQGPGSLSEQDNIRAQNETIRCLCCSVYRRRFGSDRALKHHMKTKHSFRAIGRRGLACKACNSPAFSSPTNAALHYLEKHHTPSGGTISTQPNQHSSHSSHVLRGSEDSDQHGSPPVAGSFGQSEQAPFIVGSNTAVSSGSSQDGVLEQATPSTEASGNQNDQLELTNIPTMLSTEEMEVESSRIVQYLIEQGDPTVL